MDDVILRLFAFDGGDNPLVQIRDNSDPSNPANSNVLATLNNPTPNDGILDSLTFTPSTAFTFIQNATYFLYVTATSGIFFWTASDPGISPTGIATNNGYLFSDDGGSSFSSSSFVVNSFQINATEVSDPPASTPEPTTMIGLIAVGVGLFATRKGKQDNN